jgi:hypothetical protein
VSVQTVGSEEKARKALAWYRRRSDIDSEMDELIRELEVAKAKAKKPFTVKELFGKKFRHPFFIAMFLQVPIQS